MFLPVADVPARLEERLIDEALTRRLLVELQDRGDFLALLLQLPELGLVHFGGALGFEPLLRLLFESSENGFVLRLGEPELFERLLGLPVGDRLCRGRRTYVRVSARWPPSTCEVEPPGDVEELVEAIEREIALDRATWMGRVVARLPHRVQLVLHDLGHRLPKRLGVHEVVQVVAEGGAKPVGLVDRR